MSAVIKYAVQEPKLIDKAIIFFEQESDNIDPELQQRANEQCIFLKSLQQREMVETVEAVFDAMPTFAEEIEKQNILLTVLEEKEKSSKNISKID